MNLINYISDNEFRINCTFNSLNIVNFDEIKDFNSEKVVVIKNDNDVIVCGDNLFISKLLKDEILINGTIKKVEYGSYNG